MKHESPAEQFHQTKPKVEGIVKDLQSVRDIGMQMKQAGVKLSASHEFHNAPKTPNMPQQQARGRSL